MLNSLVRVSRRGGWSTDLAITAEGGRATTGKPAAQGAAPSPLIKPSQGSQDFIHRGFPPPPAPLRGTRARRGTSPPGPWTSPAMAAAIYFEEKYALRRRRDRPEAVPCPRQHGTRASTYWIPLGPADAIELNPLISIYEFHPFRLLTVSRTIELSLQSSFQLSLTVLVRYRSRGHI